jgi:protein involved in polysaccharide export with SLBB domain
MSLFNSRRSILAVFARRIAFGAVALVVCGVASSASAQLPRKTATRSELEEAATRLRQSAQGTKNSSARATLLKQEQRIRQRLQEGDFQAGHRILLSVYGDSALSDTFTVRADRKLLLPNLPPVSVVGVLDSELESFLTSQLSKYLKSPTVRAQGLLRVSVLGSVGQPGFYSFPMDFALTDVVMEAGGPDNGADMSRAEIRRSGSVAIDKKGMQEAFRLGLTLNDVGVRPGDELIIPGGSNSKWQRVATIAGVVTGLAWTVSALVR